MDFEVTQKLHSLKCVLNEAKSIIATTIDIVEAISRHSAVLAPFANIPVQLQEAFQIELEQIVLDLRNHARKVDALCTLSDDIRLMVCCLGKISNEWENANSLVRVTKFSNSGTVT